MVDDSATKNAQKELAQNLEFDAGRLTSALSKLHEQVNIASNPIVSMDGVTHARNSSNHPATSAAGLYGLSERDNWLLSQSPNVSNGYNNGATGQYQMSGVQQ